MVQVKTIDQIWQDLSRPQVSLIKIDIEGGEYAAILGATQLIGQCKPHILFEWHATNLAADNRDPQDIFDFRQAGYDLLALPQLQPVTSALLPLDDGTNRNVPAHAIKSKVLNAKN